MRDRSSEVQNTLLAIGSDPSLRFGTSTECLQALDRFPLGEVVDTDESPLTLIAGLQEYFKDYFDRVILPTHLDQIPAVDASPRPSLAFKRKELEPSRISDWLVSHLRLPKSHNRLRFQEDFQFDADASVMMVEAGDHEIPSRNGSPVQSVGAISFLLGVSATRNNCRITPVDGGKWWLGLDLRVAPPFNPAIQRTWQGRLRTWNVTEDKADQDSARVDTRERRSQADSIERAKTLLAQGLRKPFQGGAPQ